MKRAVWIAVALAACGNKSDSKKRDAAALTRPIDAAPVAVDTRPASLADAEPTSPPPPPTLGKGRGDCKPEYAPKPTRDPNPMCKVPGGTFVMGTDSGDMKESKPAHKVRVKPFRVDRYEVTVQQVVFYLNTVKDNACPRATDNECFSVGGDPELLRIENGRFVAGRGYAEAARAGGPSADRMPMFRASIEGADRYCAWAGKRVVTDAEWEYAARHDPKTGKDLIYPWGDKFEKNRTNCSDDDCGDPFPNLAPVGSFDGTNGRGDGSSPFGLHDMVGNAEEVVATCYAPYKPCTDACDAEQPTTEPCKRVLRSQSFASPKSVLATYIRVDTNDGGGFRCAVSD